MVEVITLLYDWLAQSNIHHAQMVFLLFFVSMQLLKIEIFLELQNKGKHILELYLDYWLK